jgi:hypothetical protein
MSETSSDRPVTVTAQERAHPAIRKLARACIALARHLREATTAPSSPQQRNTNGADGEVAHD